MKLRQEPEKNFLFSAAWIGPQNENGQFNCYFDARTFFELNRIPKTALLRITSDTNYSLEINGIACGHGPIRGTAILQYFDTIDVTETLRLGKNEIKVRIYSPIEEDFICATVAPALLLELPGIVKSGTDWQIRLLPEWKRDVPLFTRQTGFMEFRDFRVAPAEWFPAVKVTEPRLLKKKLVPRDIPPIDLFFVRPVDLTTCAEVPPGDTKSLEMLPTHLNNEPWKTLQANRFDGIVLQPATDGSGAAMVWDFAEEWIGRLALEIEAPVGTVVDLVYGEEPWYDGRLRAAFPNNIYRFTDRYILKAGKNTVGTTMTERGFRYVQAVFRNFSSPVILDNISAEVLRYPYENRGAFHCSDPLLNAVYKQCVETLRACTTDTFLDCPWRERAFWVNDLVVENRTSLAAFGVSEIHRRAFRLAFSQQQANGLIPGLCPQPTGKNLVLPPTNFFLVMMLYDYYNASGDAETVRNYLEAVEKIFVFFESRVDSDGLTSAPPEFWNFYDWGFELDGYSFSGLRESMINSLYVYALKIFLKLDAATDYHSPHLAEYRIRIKRTSEAIERVFRDSTTGYLVDPVKLNNQLTTLSSQLSHSIALLAGIGSKSLQQSCIHAIADENIHMPDFYLHDFIFQAMTRHGLVQSGLERVRNYWGRMALSAHPTLYEVGIHKFGREAFDDSGSLCHGFGTGPIAFLQTGILGVISSSGGFKTFDFCPDRAGLTFAEGRVPTPYGNIAVKLDATGAEIRIPFPCEAHLKSGAILKFGYHRLNWEAVK